MQTCPTCAFCTASTRPVLTSQYIGTTVTSTAKNYRLRRRGGARGVHPWPPQHENIVCRVPPQFVHNVHRLMAAACANRGGETVAKCV